MVSSVAAMLVMAMGAAPPAVPVVAGTPAPPPETLALPADDEPLYASPTRRDRIGRILAPVMINGQGPFRFVVDTGATHSVIGEHLTRRLQLPVSEVSGVMLRGVTGSALVATAQVQRFQAGDLVMENLHMPVIAAVLPGADGVLGVQGLEDKRIYVDFSRDHIQIARSRSEGRREGFLKVPVTLGFNRLLLAEGRVGRVRVKAILDTGAERTLGNLALRDALARTGGSRGDRSSIDVQGVTADIQTGDLMSAPRIRLGEMYITQVAVTFGDMHVFEVWGFEDEPALLVGMDVLGILDAVVIDYRKREVQFKPQSRLEVKFLH